MKTLRTATLIRARFGIPIELGAGRERADRLRIEASRCATQIHRQLAPGQLALVTGPSGSGKSMIMRALAHTIHRPVIASPISGRARKPTIETLSTPIEERLRLLGVCGLADAHPLVAQAGTLSEGQKARLSLAQAFEQAEHNENPCTILADEFCSTLDRTTAISIAASVRRVLSQPTRLIVATAHDDLIEHLKPDILVYVPLEGQAEILTRPNISRNDPCTPIPGRSCPSISTPVSKPASHERPGMTPGRSASARARSTTTPASLGFTTELLPPQPSSA